MSLANINVAICWANISVALVIFGATILWRLGVKLCSGCWDTVISYMWWICFSPWLGIFNSRMGEIGRAGQWSWKPHPSLWGCHMQQWAYEAYDVIHVVGFSHFWVPQYNFFVITKNTGFLEHQQSCQPHQTVVLSRKTLKNLHIVVLPGVVLSIVLANYTFRHLVKFVRIQDQMWFRSSTIMLQPSLLYVLFRTYVHMNLGRAHIGGLHICISKWECNLD